MKTRLACGINLSKSSGFYAGYGKRVLDFVVASAVLVLVAPALLLSALLIKTDSEGPLFFLQERLARGGKLYRVYKLRTMTSRPRVPDREILGQHPDVTRVGRWLRRLKIDELPQLINVIRGEMSLVGPRPALPSQLQEYDSEARRRLLVRPGLTGLAQVSGNVYLSWPDRWRCDVAYVDHLSLLLDLRILARTAVLLVIGEQRMAERVSRRQAGMWR